MNRTTLKGIAAKLALGLVALALAAAPSFAQVNLVALEATATLPDGNVVPMWGYFNDTGQLCTEVPAWQVGPTLTATAAGSLTINLRNCLSEPVSVFIPGQLKATTPVTFNDPQGRSRVRSFDAETAAGAAGIYTWTGVKEGTYLYHSGTHPQVQVQMGLYGALTVGNYGIANEATLVYSEIDPALHAAVAGGTYGTPPGPTSTFDYKPRYFLINGAAYPDGADIGVNTNEDVLLRFVNAGLKTHVPTLEGGLYMSLIAEDGNLYPSEMLPIEQYGIELQAAKTIDAVINVGETGRYALYDRSLLGLTNWLDSGGGMLTYIQASPANCTIDAECDDGLFCNGTETCLAGACQVGTPPVCDNGTFCDGAETCNEGTDSCDAGTPPSCDDGVGCTDDSCNPGTDSCDNLVDDGNCPDDGLYCNGAEFCDAALDCSSTGDPCPAGEICSEDVGTYTCDPAANVPPFANDDFETTTRNTAVTFSVTANDVDADGTIDVASVVITSGLTTQRGGTVVQNGDGTVTFTPKNGFRGTDLFTYTVDDDAGVTSNVATVGINVVKP